MSDQNIAPLKVTRKNAFYAQSGGSAAVINASAAGVVAGVKSHRDKIDNLYVGRNGILGALNEDMMILNLEDEKLIEDLLHTPAGAFGSCRYKLSDFEEDESEYARILAVFEAHNIGYFFYNGGGDSQDTTHKLAKYAELNNSSLVCIGIPKTIDNELPHTDSCPGYGSVAKYVAISILEASMDVASMCETSTKVFVMEVMGRHSGWIAAAAGLAADERGLGPDLIVFPEVPFEEYKFYAEINRAVVRKGFCVIVVSEGVKGPDGKHLIDRSVTDAFGHSQLGGAASYIAGRIRTVTGHKTHFAVCDYLQRSARHIGSKTDLDQAYMVGKKAVEFSVSGRNAVMTSIVRESEQPYRWSVSCSPLKEVLNLDKCLPDSFISSCGFKITEQCRRYIQPLISGESYPDYLNGLPAYRVFNSKKLPKKLESFHASKMGDLSPVTA